MKKMFYVSASGRKGVQIDVQGPGLANFAVFGRSARHAKRKALAWLASQG